LINFSKFNHRQKQSTPKENNLFFGWTWSRAAVTFFVLSNLR